MVQFVRTIIHCFCCHISFLLMKERTMKFKNIFFIATATILLTACATTYKSASELRARTEHRTAFTVEVEHKKMFTETLEFLRPCWERQAGSVSMQVLGEFVGTTSQISYGIYGVSSPSIIFVIDMSSAGTGTEIVMSGVGDQGALAERIKLIAAGKAPKCNET